MGHPTDSFNSLFEMPVTFRDMSDGSIHTTFNSLFEMPISRRLGPFAVDVLTFNSLFEMRERSEEPARAVDLYLSILYLRCALSYANASE